MLCCSTSFSIHGCYTFPTPKWSKTDLMYFRTPSPCKQFSSVYRIPAFFGSFYPDNIYGSRIFLALLVVLQTSAIQGSENFFILPWTRFYTSFLLPIRLPFFVYFIITWKSWVFFVFYWSHPSFDTLVFNASFGHLYLHLSTPCLSFPFSVIFNSRCLSRASTRDTSVAFSLSALSSHRLRTQHLQLWCCVLAPAAVSPHGCGRHMLLQELRKVPQCGFKICTFSFANKIFSINFQARLVES